MGILRTTRVLQIPRSTHEYRWLLRSTGEFQWALQSAAEYRGIPQTIVFCDDPTLLRLITIFFWFQKISREQGLYRGIIQKLILYHINYKKYVIKLITDLCYFCNYLKIDYKHLKKYFLKHRMPADMNYYVKHASSIFVFVGLFNKLSYSAFLVTQLNMLCNLNNIH